MSDGAPAVGAVLAGGAGRRMGRAKASVELAGRPLIAYPLEAVRAAGLDPLVVAKPDSELPPGVGPVAAEPAEPRHPLTGIVAALEFARGRPVVVLACDMPFVTPALVAWIAALPDRLAVAHAGGRIHPLLGRYAPKLGEPLRAGLAAGEPLTAVVAALEPRIVGHAELSRFGDPERIAFNVNTPADLELAERALAVGRREPGRLRGSE